MSKKKILISIIIFTILILVLITVLNPSHKYNKLIISESKWNSIKESRIENKNLVLTDIRFNDYKLIIDEKNNTLYYSLINNSQNKYNPSISYSTNDNRMNHLNSQRLQSNMPEPNKNVKLAILSYEITDEKVKSEYQFKIMIYNENEYHIYNLKCTDLPILSINYNRSEDINQKNISMEMYLFDNLTNVPNRITISMGKVKVDNDSYIFSLHMLTPGKNKRDNKISIFNMHPNSEYILTPISNESEKNLDTNHRVELFLNNEYEGVYSLGYIYED